MKTKNLLAGTFLDDALKLKGPIRRVPKDHFPKLLNEEFIDVMNELEKRLFTIALMKLDDIKKLRNSVRDKKSNIPRFIPNEDLTTIWHRKATTEEKMELENMRTDYKCINGILFNLIKSRIPVFHNELILVLRPGYRIVVGIKDKADPLAISFNNYSAFSIPIRSIGIDVAN